MLHLAQTILGSPPATTPQDPDFELKPGQIIRTAHTLKQRVEADFAGRGIDRMASRLESLAQGTMHQITWARRPLLGIRMVSLVAVLAIVGFGLRIAIGWQLPTGVSTLVDLAEVMDAFMNELIVVGAGLFFVFSFEGRVKRRRALGALRHLRAMAHIIDMHQLTKDPSHARTYRGPTGGNGSTGTTEADTYELLAYLDFSSEMLAIVAKLAALYAQSLDDPVVLAAVTEVESLTSGLAAKIWQKIMILDRGLSS